MKKTVIISLISVTLFAFTTVTNKQNLIKDSCVNTFDNEKIWDGNLSEDKLDEFLKGSYTVVKGDISIENTKLTDLKSLSNLKRCEGIFYIKWNDVLNNIKGLHNLKWVNKFYIGSNPQLGTFEGLQNLEAVNTLDVNDNKNLYDITTLSGITVLYELSITDNVSLANLEGLQNIKSIKGNLSIENNDVTNLEGLRSLTEVGKELTISSNSRLKTLEGLEQIQKIKKIYISRNRNLTSLSNFKNLKSIDMLFISNSRSLIELTGFTAVKNIKELHVNSNKNLKIINFFEGLTNVKKLIEIEHNNSLKNVMGFNKLKNIGGDFRVSNNDSLKKITGFNNLEKVNTLFIWYNIFLESVENFKNLTYVESRLIIKGNHSLKSLKGLEKLKSVKVSVSIDNNNVNDFSVLSMPLLTYLVKNKTQYIFEDNNNNSIKIDELIENTTFRTLMTREFLKDKSKHKLYLMRNEILARKGYVFKDEELQKLFQSKKWYKPNNIGKIKLSEIDKKNIKLIEGIEKEIADYAVKLVPIIKNKFKTEAPFANNHKEYQSKIIDFIKTIDIDTILKSNRLSYHKDYFLHKDENNNYIENDRTEDRIHIFFGESKNVFSIVIANYFVYEFSGEIGRELTVFDFMIKKDYSFEYNKDFRKNN